MVPDRHSQLSRILIEAGKEGRLLVLNRNDLGGNNSGGFPILARFKTLLAKSAACGAPLLIGMANVYFWPRTTRAFSLTGGIISGEPVSPRHLF